MKTVVFDLDGTLALIDHRLHYIRGARKNYEAFFASCVYDPPNEPVCALLRQLFNHSAWDIIIVSGRSDKVRSETAQWLEDNRLCYEQLIMRREGDFRADDVIKEEILDQLLAEGREILFTIDDRQRVVDMWRRRGITCLQCAQWEEGTRKFVRKKGLLTLMIGPSGAGKSEFLLKEGKAHGINPSHIISSDQIRQDLHGDFRNQEHNAEVFAVLHKIVKSRIEIGLPCTVDATNIRRRDRLKIVELAEGGPVRYIVIDRPLQEKLDNAGWRREAPGLIERHHEVFQNNLKNILAGDEQANVEVLDRRKI